MTKDSLTAEEKVERHVDFLANKEKISTIGYALVWIVIGALVFFLFPIVGSIVVIIGIVSLIFGVPIR